MNSPNPAEASTAVPAQEKPARRPLTRRIADFYVKQTFGRQARIKYWPAGLMPYSVVRRQLGTSVLTVLGEGETFEEAIVAAIKSTEVKEAPLKAEPVQEVKK